MIDERKTPQRTRSRWYTWKLSSRELAEIDQELDQPRALVDAHRAFDDGPR
jgi:hypothetical protein